MKNILQKIMKNKLQKIMKNKLHNTIKYITLQEYKKYSTFRNIIKQILQQEREALTQGRDAIPAPIITNVNKTWLNNRPDPDSPACNPRLMMLL